MAILSRSLPRKRRQLTINEKRNLAKGVLFISPWIFGFIAFMVYPILASFYYSFTYYDIIGDPRWIGLRNYQALLFEDTNFRVVLWNTIYFVMLGVPLGAVVAFLLASLLNNEFIEHGINI